MTAAEFLGRLDRVRKSGSGWTARCPAHEDHHASLSVGEGTDGRILLKCFAGCSAEAIVRALGLELLDLFTDARATPRDPVDPVPSRPRSPIPPRIPLDRALRDR